MKGKPCSDILDPANNKASYLIHDNENKITEESSDKIINLIVFSGGIQNNEIYENKNIARLVMSEELKNEYNMKKKELQEQNQEIKAIISKKIIEENNITIKADGIIYDLIGSMDYYRLVYSYIPKKYEEFTLNHDCSSIHYLDVVNEKVEKLVNNVDFINECKSYVGLVQVELTKEIFNNKFSITDLKEIVDIATKKKYFLAGHKFHINKIDYGEMEVNALINEEIKKAYQKADVLKKLENIKKKFNKNAKTKKFVKLLESNIWLIDEFSNYNTLKKKIFITKLGDSIHELIDMYGKIEAIQKQLDGIITKAERYRSKWKRVMDIYESRFICNNFYLKIENMKEATIGKEMPTFVKYLKNNDIKVDENIRKRFSTGERRAILILNLIFEIEVMKEGGINSQ